MSEVKCRVCGGETIQEDGICRPCALFRKDEVAALLESGRQKIKSAAKNKPVIPACPESFRKEGLPRDARDNDKKTKRRMKMRKNKVCSKCNTVALSNRTKECHKCGEPFIKKAAAGREEKKKRGRPTNYERQKEIATAAPRNDKKAATKSRGNGSTDDVMLKLINVKSEYQQKLSEIDNAIEVLKKYA